MFNESDLQRLQPLIAQANLDGWLLFDFRGRNPVAAAVLGSEIVGTRRVFVLIPRQGKPVALVHAIDNELWRHWPTHWTKHVWVAREELAKLLHDLVGGRRLAVEYSPGGAIPYLDGVPAGVFESFKSAGAAALVSSVDLVTRFCSVWTPAETAAHCRAAETISRIAREAIALAGRHARSTQPWSEHQIGEWIKAQFVAEGLVTIGNPSVSYGANAARNHYDPNADEAALIVPGKMLLVDLWAREPDGIFADQTWMASIGTPSARDEKIWRTVQIGRDAALDLLHARVRAGQPVTGAEADHAARAVTQAAGYGHCIEARTGHSIDRFGLHGFGPPVDGTETYDTRVVIPGVGFSVEPGIYLKGDAGVRTEVNVFVREDDIVVTPAEYQHDLIIV